MSVGYFCFDTTGISCLSAQRITCFYDCHEKSLMMVVLIYPEEAWLVKLLEPALEPLLHKPLMLEIPEPLGGTWESLESMVVFGLSYKISFRSLP